MGNIPHSILERELLKACNREPWGYDDRQHYLRKLASLIFRISDEAFDALSEEAVDWYDKAAKAIQANKPIMDFDESEGAIDAHVKSSMDIIEPDAENETPVEALAVEAPLQENKQPLKKQPKAEKKESKPKKAAVQTDASKLDRYGLLLKSKRHQAVLLFEKGTTQNDLRKALGMPFYNLLTDLKKGGHHVSREGTTITVIHKDDYGAKAKGKG